MNVDKMAVKGMLAKIDELEGTVSALTSRLAARSEMLVISMNTVDELEARLDYGLTPKGLPMPDTIEEWKYLASVYGRGLEIEKREKSLLRVELNKLKQKIDKMNRSVK